MSSDLKKKNKQIECVCRYIYYDLNGLRELFTIDTDPVKKLDSVQVPSYKRVIKDALLDEETKTKKKEEQESNEMKMLRRSGACFNCGATEHGLKDCRLQRNVPLINCSLCQTDESSI
uniref:CCHC-type domain-containing protein n=1 Tax=Glossina brevipalpis TaxID=37001 RepID=A0A1A9W5G2_9MUSC